MVGIIWRRLRGLVFRTVPIFATSCAPQPAPLDDPPTLVSTSVDSTDVPVSPTATLVARFSGPPDAETLQAGIALVTGTADASIFRELARTPRSMATAARVVPARLTALPGSASISLLPSQPLAPAAPYTLVATNEIRVGGQRIAAQVMRPFTTDSDDAAAAVPSLIAPADGAGDVVLNLARVQVAFSRAVSGVDGASLQLVAEDGSIAPAMVAASVDGLAARAGSATARFDLQLLAPLLPDTRYQIVLGDGVVDDAGNAPFPPDPPPAFGTGETLRTTPPVAGPLSLETSSGCVVARFGTDEPTIATLCLGRGCGEGSPLDTAHELSSALAPGEVASVKIEARDLSTVPQLTLGPVATPASSPRPLVITEALSRPKGGVHLAQQFVEVRNVGAEPTSLAGLVFHDDAGANSPLLDATLAPGGFALIVPADFVVDDGADPVPDAAATIVRVVEPHLGKNGIRVSGEALALTEPDGRFVSRFSTVGLSLAAGQSATRVGACDVAASFAPTPGRTATPGGP